MWHRDNVDIALIVRTHIIHWLHIVPGMTVERFFGTFCARTDSVFKN